jgi:hypothetical protein
MFESAQPIIASTYSVEASGWDGTQSFFVEKAELEWNESRGKFLLLNHSLSPESVIFLRLIQPTAPDRSLPVAYRAEHIAVTPGGQHQFRLSQVHPRSSLKDQLD